MAWDGRSGHATSTTHTWRGWRLRAAALALTRGARSTQSHMEYACWGSARAADFGYNLRKLDSELREIRAVMHTIMCMCLLLSLGSLRSALVALCL